MKARIVILISILAGGGDFATGLMLLGAPAQALALMGVPAVREVVWIRYIGVFVACVGISYFGGLLSWWDRGSQTRLRVVWEFTALFRGMVGTFVGVEILLRALQPGWLTVVATDWFWALLQAILLRGRFFEVL